MHTVLLNILSSASPVKFSIGLNPQVYYSCQRRWTSPLTPRDLITISSDIGSSAEDSHGAWTSRHASGGTDSKIVHGNFNFVSPCGDGSGRQGRLDTGMAPVVYTSIPTDHRMRRKSIFGVDRPAVGPSRHGRRVTSLIRGL